MYGPWINSYTKCKKKCSLFVRDSVSNALSRRLHRKQTRCQTQIHAFFPRKNDMYGRFGSSANGDPTDILAGDHPAALAANRRTRRNSNKHILTRKSKLWGNNIARNDAMNSIVLITDFGSDSPYVAEMKGAILSINNDVRIVDGTHSCLLYTSPSPRDRTRSRMPSSA